MRFRSRDLTAVHAGTATRTERDLGREAGTLPETTLE